MVISHLAAASTVGGDTKVRLQHDGNRLSPSRLNYRAEITESWIVVRLRADIAICGTKIAEVIARRPVSVSRGV
jgi:hypothetical protein